jgi:hypothetical protein
MKAETEEGRRERIEDRGSNIEGLKMVALQSFRDLGARRSQTQFDGWEVENLRLQSRRDDLSIESAWVRVRNSGGVTLFPLKDAACSLRSLLWSYSVRTPVSPIDRSSLRDVQPQVLDLRSIKLSVTEYQAQSNDSQGGRLL